MELPRPLKRHFREREVKRVIEDSYPRLVRYCHGFVRDREEACEVAQDVCCQFWTQQESVKDHTRLCAYLFSIAHNACINRLRRNSIFTNRDPQFFEDLPDRDPDCPPELADFRCEVLQRIVSELPEGMERLIVTDYYYGGDLTTREIARNRQIPHGTVTVYLKRARARILKRFVAETAKCM